MGQLNHEPSMEDILASIKRIIAEDGDAALSASSQPRRQRPQRNAPPAHSGLAAKDAGGSEDEVLELTESMADQPATPPAPPEEIAAAPTEASAEAPQRAPAANAATPPAESARAEPVGDEPPAPLISPNAAEASRASLAALSSLVVRPEPPLADNTLEGLVREMLRPMIKEWLDARLPGVVERLVSREIARITGQP
jgi:uncharacterized protein